MLARTLYSTLKMEKPYRIEAKDPMHHWAPDLNNALDEYKSTHKGDVNKSLFFSWVNANKPKLLRVHYFDPQELEALKVDFKSDNEIVYHKTQTKINKNDAGHGPENETYMLMFAMSPEGEFYVHKKFKSKEDGGLCFNHSSFFSGKPLSGVGFFHFDKDMNLIAIDDYSGHYKPSNEQMLNVFHALTEKGVDLGKVTYNHRIDPVKFDNEKFNAKAWYDEHRHEHSLSVPTKKVNVG